MKLVIEKVIVSEPLFLNGKETEFKQLYEVDLEKKTCEAERSAEVFASAFSNEQESMDDRCQKVLDMVMAAFNGLAFENN